MAMTGAGDLQGGNAHDAHGQRSLSRKPRPLPHAVRHLLRQPPPQLSRDQTELPAMVRLVSNEVAEEMVKVRREVLPGCRRYPAAPCCTKSNEADDTVAAARQRCQKIAGADPPQVDQGRYRHSMGSPERLDPPASRVVDVRRDHAWSEPGHCWNPRRPDICRIVLNQVGRRPVVGPPRSDDVPAQFSRGLNVSGRRNPNAGRRRSVFVHRRRGAQAPDVSTPTGCPSRLANVALRLTSWPRFFMPVGTDAAHATSVGARSNKIAHTTSDPESA
jgi:hypothetical protein